MNNRFNGELDITNLKGLQSEAAKQAFQDMKDDKDMKRTILEINGHIVKTNTILTEDILTQDE